MTFSLLGGIMRFPTLEGGVRLKEKEAKNFFGLHLITVLNQTQVMGSITDQT